MLRYVVTCIGAYYIQHVGHCTVYKRMMLSYKYYIIFVITNNIVDYGLYTVYLYITQHNQT